MPISQGFADRVDELIGSSKLPLILPAGHDGEKAVLLRNSFSEAATHACNRVLETMTMKTKLETDAEYAGLIAESDKRSARAAMLQRSDVGEASWYLVHVAAGSEGSTGAHLKRFGFEFYYPNTRILRRVPRKQLSVKQRQSGALVRRPKDEPLFKGYMFVHFNLQTGLWREVFRMRGVRGMVYNNDQPAFVKQKEVDRIRKLEVDGAVPGSTKIEDVLGFSIGDKVIVEDGPFRSFSGVVERFPSGYQPGSTVEDLDESMRCRILVNIFGRETPVLLEASQFAPA